MAADAATEERELIRRLRAGDRDALARLIDRYGEPLMHYLVSILGSREEAEDAFQDTWVRLVQRARRLDPGRPFAPWLFRVARNRAFDHLRWRRRWSPLGSGVDEERPPAGAPPARPVAAQRAEARDLAAKLLAGLDPVRREVIWLRFYLDCSYEEIAAICGVRPGTVKSRLHRALDRLAVLHARLEKANSEDRLGVGTDR